MKRLTYAPKAYIFIRSNNMGGQIYNVSDDCVRGSLTQNLGDVSTLTFSLRNRYKKWLRDAGTSESTGTGQLIFTPMDLVTCWLQRLPGQPIQQFTGYLDSVPYYQGYPGDAPFTASCTLKKLAYTWFDPGLQTFWTWMIAQGWTPDPSTGQFTNYTLNYQPNTSNASDFSAATADAGFGKLLRAFMTDIANWEGADVLISDLPTDLPKAAASLFKQLSAAADQSSEALAAYFRAAMGVKVANGSTVSASGTGTTNVLSQVNEISTAIKAAATAANINPLALGYAAFMLSGLKSDYNHPSSATDPNWGYGLFALRPTVVGAVDPITGLPGGLSVTTNTIRAGGQTYRIDDMMDPNKAATAMCALLKSAPGATGFIKAAANNDTNSITAWIRAALGNRQLPTVDPTQAFEQAKQLIGTTVAASSTSGQIPNIDVSSIDWNSKQLQDLLTAQEKVSVRNYYSKTSSTWLAGLLYQIKLYLPQITIATTPKISSNHMMFITGDQSDLQSLQNSLSGDTNITKVEVINQITHLDPRQGSPNPITGLLITQDKQPPKSTLITNPANTGTTPGYTSWKDLSAFVATSAFASNFSFQNYDFVLSQGLTGDKALMNDVSCLDTMKQLTGASMRTFRSMPDGRFLAFYPDYFGAYRGPYLQIENIELIDFGIVLNDEQLATHVYVTGDTIDMQGTVDYLEKITTHGVATITQEAMLGTFIAPWDPTQPNGELQNLRSAWEFLQHYGARPLSTENPMIHNSAFEFLNAWGTFMLKWSRLFQTTVSTTFKPEIMAGGIIEFPDHHVQMFVESVTHSWDYESGFHTEATLTAPSLPKGDRKAGKQMPGFALAGVRTPGLDGAG